MNDYAGIDVSLEESCICVYAPEGTDDQWRQNSAAQELIALVADERPGWVDWPGRSLVTKAEGERKHQVIDDQPRNTRKRSGFFRESSRGKPEPDYRFYLLYGKTCREGILQHANAGAPGVDGLTFEEIDYSGGPLPNWCWNRSPKQTSRCLRLPSPAAARAGLSRCTG
jgi:hypothetical protein